MSGCYIFVFQQFRKWKRIKVWKFAICTINMQRTNRSRKFQPNRGILWKTALNNGMVRMMKAQPLLKHTNINHNSLCQQARRCWIYCDVQDNFDWKKVLECNKKLDSIQMLQKDRRGNFCQFLFLHCKHQPTLDSFPTIVLLFMHVWPQHIYRPHPNSMYVRIPSLTSQRPARSKQSTRTCSQLAYCPKWTIFRKMQAQTFLRIPFAHRSFMNAYLVLTACFLPSISPDNPLNFSL